MKVAALRTFSRGQGLGACIIQQTLAATLNKMKRSGHILILRPDLDLERYEVADFTKANRHHLKRLRDLLNFINPINYRGTGRDFFDTWPYMVNSKGEVELYEDNDSTIHDNLTARKKLAELEGKAGNHDSFDDLTFYSLPDMLEVFGLLESKDDYEIIQFLENEPNTTLHTLGFDIGYLATDYSVIADTAIKPIWHPPDFEDMGDIIEHLRKLNVNCLFSTFQDAKDYRECYLAKKWGEKETFEGQITVIQVREVEKRVYAQ